MIWFFCKQCGKVHGRPENSAGSMIFCGCGQGNIVPWESTAGAPATPPAAAPEPIPLREEPPAPQVLPRVRPGRDRPRPDPAHCLNHEAVASTHKCEDCGEAFCADCVLVFQGTTLCGPCKNFRVRRLMRIPRLSGLAFASLLVSLAGLFVFAVFALATSSSSWALGSACMLSQVVALALGGLALHITERDAQRGGRALAITGMTTATLAAALMLTATMYLNRMFG